MMHGGGVTEGIGGMKTYLHGPMGFTKALKRRFRVGGLDLPARRKRYLVCQYQYSREEEEGDAQMWSRGEAVASGTHIHSRYWENVKCTRRKVIRFVEEEMRAIENVTWRRLVLY